MSDEIEYPARMREGVCPVKVHGDDPCSDCGAKLLGACATCGHEDPNFTMCNWLPTLKAFTRVDEGCVKLAEKLTEAEEKLVTANVEFKAALEEIRHIRAHQTGTCTKCGMGVPLTICSTCLANVQADLTRLRADIARGDRDAGRPTAWAYEQACEALRKHTDEERRLRAEVERLAALVEKHEDARITALKAACAGEGIGLVVLGETCETCGGRGRVVAAWRTSGREICPDCHGTGKRGGDAAS